MLSAILVVFYGEYGKRISAIFSPAMRKEFCRAGNPGTLRSR